MSENLYTSDTYPPEWPFLNEKFIIYVESEVNISESEQKVRQAINNILPDLELNLDEQNYLKGVSDNINTLFKFFNLVFDQKILDVARRCAIEGSENNYDGKIQNKIILYLNKQIALINKINFSSQSESPLGPIKITIEVQSIEKFIDSYFPKFEWFKKSSKNKVNRKK